MMSAIANTVPKPEGFEKYVRKFRSICAMHGVQMGSRTELSGFLQKLLEDRHLAMDFWAFIGKVSVREGGQLSDDQMIGVVVEGITDTELSAEDTGQEPTVDNLRAMLAGVDIQAPQQTVVMAPFPQSEPSPVETMGPPKIEARPERDPEQAMRVAESPRAAESMRAAESATAQSSTTTTNSQAAPTVDSRPAPRIPAPAAAAQEKAPEVDRPVVLPQPALPLHLDEARLRLELTKLVQEYFENIDKRISKLEPHAEDVTSAGNPATAVTPRSLDEPDTVAEEEELRLRRIGRTRIVLEPPDLPGQILLAAKDIDRPMHIPLEHYTPPPRFGRAPLILVLVLIGAGFEIYRDPSLLRHAYTVVVSHFKIKHEDLVPEPPPSPSRSYDQGPASAGPTQQAAMQPPAAASPTPAPEDASKQTPPAGTAQSADNRADSSTNHPVERAVVQTGEAIAEGISAIEAAGAIKVSPSVMDRNLIVSRLPAYPEFAKLNRVQGDVVMQALISKEGTVKRVQVTEGDSRLRSAAEEAVYKRRYRPYVLNGQPVEVATTVTVNFNLNR